MFAIPVSCATVLLVAGARAPTPGSVLLLAVAAALAVNRSVFFPSEQAATAEVAVVLAAVTGFAGDAPWLGPVVIALLMGPLDASHWEHRAFLRMTYNAGNRGLCSLASATAFLLVGAATTEAVAAIAAAAAFVAVDFSLSSVLLVVQGTPARLAAGRMVAVDRFGLPLAILGAAVGFVADRVGWWPAVALLAPLAFVPEQLILARARFPRTQVGARLSNVVVVGLVTACVLWALGSPGTATAAAMLTVAVLVGAELEVDAGRPVPPLLVVVVVATAVVVTGRGAYVLAPVAALVAAVTAWSCTVPRPTRARAATGVAVVVAASLATVGLASLARSSFVVPSALFAGLVVPLAAVVVSDGRRALLVAFGWSAPFVGLAVAVAGAWRVVGPLGAALFASWLGAALVVAGSFGTLPWIVRRSGGARWDTLDFSHRAGVAVAAVAIAVLGGVAILWPGRVVGVVAAWLAVAVVETMAAVDLVGIRQWRLAPRARARAIALVVIGASVGAVGCPGDVVGRGWSTVALLAAAVLLVAAGWVPARCVDTARRLTMHQGHGT